MEWVDVPIRRPVALLNYLERELVSRGDNSSTRLTLRKELLFAYLFCFRVMRDKDDIDIIVLGSQKPNHPKIKTARDILLKLAHRSGNVDHRDDDGVGLVTHYLFPRLESQVFLLDVAEARLAFASVATNIFQNHPALIEIGDDTGAPDLIELRLARLDSFFCFFFEVGELEIFED